MEFFLRFEIYILFLFYPVLMGLLVRSKKITFKSFILTTNILVSIFIGTLYLYSVASSIASSTQFILSPGDWITATAVSLFLWLLLFLMTRPFHKN